MALPGLEDLIMAITKLDYKTLIDLAAKNRSKKYQFTFYESFKSRKESDMAKTIGDLNRMIISCMEKYLGHCENANWASLDSENCNEFNQIIQAAIDIALTSFQLNYAPSRNLLQMAVLLNGIILEIPNSLDSLKNSIAHLCEKMCCADFVDKSQYFLFNVLIYLLRRTLEKKSLKTDVKRVYSMRETIRNIMSMDKANTVEIWELFKKCAVSSLYLSMIEGQKVIALSMTLDIDRISIIHDVIRERLPQCSLKIASSYGRVYFEAWTYCIRAKKPDLKNVIEIACLQDFILLAIREYKRPYLSVVRKVLNEFHLHKKELEVSKMLFFLYQPLLWRFLKNPDGQIRANAAQLFLDIFPLEDPDVKVVTTDLELNDQLLVIKDLLLDEYPIVRVTVVVGLCIQMSVNWEVFPEEMLKTYFKIIVDDLSCDSSSSEVRCSVARAVKVLLENPLTISTMQCILPKLAGLFHDVSENVRIAFCQLLLRLKRISAIKYFDIIPLDHLLARMEEDCHAVKKSIANLIHNSYFPKNEDPKIWLGRSLLIMKQETAAAARVFFTYVTSFIGFENSVKFMIQAVKAVHFYVRTKNTSTEVCSFIEPSNKENLINIKPVVSLEEAVGFDDLHVVRTLMDCIGIMWLSLKADVVMEENKMYWKMLVAKVGKPLAELCLHYKITEIWDSVFFVSSFLPASLVPSLASLCFFRLKNLPLVAPPSEYMIILECLCNQHQCTELLQLLKDWIETGLNDSYMPPPPSKKRKSKGMNGESIYYNQPKPYLANEMLNNMFAHRGIQTSILSHGEILKEILCFIDDVKRKIEKSSAKTLKEDEAPFLQKLLFNILRLSVFLHKDEDSSVPLVDDVVKWAEKKLLKYLKSPKKKPDIYMDMLSTIFKNLCELLADITALGFVNATSTLYIQFFEKVLHTGWGYKYASIAVKFLYKHVVTAHYIYVHENESDMIEIFLNNIFKILSCFCNEAFLVDISPNDVKDIQFTLASVMQIVNNYMAVYNAQASDVFEFFIKSILDSLLIVTNKTVSNGIDELSVKISFPTVAAFFLPIIIQKPKLLVVYMRHFNEYYENENTNKDIPFWIACLTLLHYIIGMKSTSKQILTETLKLVLNLERTLKTIFPGIVTCNGVRQSRNIIDMGVLERHCVNEFYKAKKLQYLKLGTAKNDFRKL